MRKRWTDREDAVLRDAYGKQPYREIYAQLPGRTRCSIKGRARNIGLHGNKTVVMPLAMKTYSVRHDYFSIPNIENSYWAGFLAADGCISPRRNSVKVQLQAGDADHLCLFAKNVGYDGSVKQCNGGSYKSESKQAVLNICGVNSWVDDLKSVFNVTERKSLTLRPPVGLSNECMLAYAVGYIDGDGSIGVAKGKYKQSIYMYDVISLRGTDAVLQCVKHLFDVLAPSRGVEAKVHSYAGYAQYRVAGRRADVLLSAMRCLDTPKMNRKWL